MTDNLGAGPERQVEISLSEPNTARGSDANFCWKYPVEGHHMVSQSAGKKVRFVERCMFCGWIDGDALDGWADNAIKENLSARAQRIAVAVDTEPFAFVQPSSGHLDLREILTQALAASYALSIQDGMQHQADGGRMLQILDRLQAEIQREITLSAMTRSSRWG